MSSTAQPGRRRSRLRWLLLFVLLLLASHGVRHWRDRAAHPQPEQRVQAVRLVEAPTRARAVSLAYVDLPATNPAAPVVLLLHGTPAGAYELRELAEALRGPVRVLVPDLAGFGNSTRVVPDYSIRAQAAYLDALLDALAIERAHVVGFSLGGGVALELYARAPHRLASFTMLASIGVQEFELLGSYTLNRALHGAQLAAAWLAANVIPHFGLLDRVLFNVPYARSLYDSDQRPLRGILGGFEPPVLVLHGEEDPLVPPAAAEEHHRLVPQSELVWLPGLHFHAYTEPETVAGHVLDFVVRAEQGGALVRATATPERVEAAAQPFGAVHRAPASGLALLVVMLLVAVGTLVSEDLACIGAGLLVAHGLLHYSHAALAAFLGIFGGDILLYLAGRYIGRPALRRAPFRWFVREQALQDSAEWFARRGPIVILASRFVPGSRLPTYFTAGLLRQHFWLYLLYFFIAGALWAPLLVWMAATLGEHAIELLHEYKMYTLGALVAVLVALWLVIELLVPLCTFRGRRLLYGRWQRLVRCEFWPTWALYLPLWPYLVWLAIRHRGATVFTAANPAMPAGGFVGESKAEILDGFAAGVRDRLARYRLLEPGLTADAALARVGDFLAESRLDYPVVLKPDAGERGAGVCIAKSAADVRRYFERPRPALLVQEFVPGGEYGVFYYRHPREAQGRIYAITEKEFPRLAGDGKHSLEKLILRDPRAVCMARLHLHNQRARLTWVPAAGETVPLVELGNHCRGAIFRNGARLITPELTAAIDALSRGHRGFFFGRYDLRVPDEAALMAGRDFKVIELNGVTSEATSLYDPSHSALDAWRILFRQWRIAYEIGAQNRAAGVRVTSPRELLELVAHHRPPPESDASGKS
ncbi:MAG TPA: alpha/beta fold hydrolase [Kiritimatiellia bacterium]|nr:alpha/beta fold hydrolase [Kiritimatiellia bacterium]